MAGCSVRLLTESRTAPATSGFHLNTAYTYDGTGRLATLTHNRNGQSTAFAAYAYTYDAASRSHSITTTLDTTVAALGSTATINQDFTYDLVGQLTSADRTGTANDDAYTYDANGNRTSQNSASVTTGDNNRVTDDGTYTYLYDDEGNLTRRTLKADSTYVVYAWDHRNRLVSATSYNASDVAQTAQLYRYNNDDLRVGKDTQTVSTSTFTDSESYVYDGNQMVLAFDQTITSGAPVAAGTIKERYLYGPGTDHLLTDEFFGGRGASTYDLYWAALDDNGSVREVLDATGAVDEYRDYDSFGTMTTVRDSAGSAKSLAALDTVFGFAGRDWDNDTGLYYNRARWFDPRLGRFISTDPIGFGGGDTNLYRYGGNNPIDNLDPSGNSWLSKAFRSLKKDIKGIVNTAKSFLHNPGRTIERMAKDPWTWVSIIAPYAGIKAPFIGLNVGPFSYGVGVGYNLKGGGLHLGFSYLAAGKSAVTGTGFGPATFGLQSPIPALNFQRAVFAQPVRYVQPGKAMPANGDEPNVFTPDASAIVDTGDGNFILAGYVRDGQHWVPQQIIRSFRASLSPEAYDVLIKGTLDPAFYERDLAFRIQQSRRINDGGLHGKRYESVKRQRS